MLSHKSRIWVYLILFSFFVTPLSLGAEAQPPILQGDYSPKPKDIRFKMAGYYKNLISVSKTADTRENYYADVNRLRIDNKLEMGPSFRLRAVIDNEAIINDFENTPDFQTIRNSNQRQTAFLDGDAVYTDNSRVFSRFSLYRLYLGYFHPEFQAVVGKQMVDWGRFLFYSPMDLFNPISPQSLEREERIGVDALNLEYKLGSESNINLVYAPQRSLDESSLGAKLFHRLGNYDLSGIAGIFKEDLVGGVGFDGYLGNASIKGECTQTHAENGHDFFRGALGAGYSFANKINVSGEYFYNGGAEYNPAEFRTNYKFFSKVLSQKKNLFSAQVGYEITPLLKWENYAIYDLSGTSLFLNPELVYNLWTNFDLRIGLQYFCGHARSEFGSDQNVYYAQAQYFF